jgi:hypothetical protein
MPKRNRYQSLSPIRRGRVATRRQRESRLPRGNWLLGAGCNARPLFGGLTRRIRAESASLAADRAVLGQRSLVAGPVDAQAALGE